SSGIDTDVIVSRSAVPTEITVNYYDDKEAEIYVKHRDSIDTELIVNIFDVVLAEIDVVKTSKKDLELTVTKPSVFANIYVPFWDDSDVETHITPRLLNVSDTKTEIIVRTKGGAYAFII